MKVNQELPVHSMKSLITLMPNSTFPYKYERIFCYSHGPKILLRGHSSAKSYEYSTTVQEVYLNIPSSLPSTGLKRLSIISTLRDCVRTYALYFEMSGHCLELTTYGFQTQTPKLPETLPKMNIHDPTLDDS